MIPQSPRTDQELSAVLLDVPAKARPAILIEEFHRMGYQRTLRAMEAPDPKGAEKAPAKKPTPKPPSPPKEK